MDERKLAELVLDFRRIGQMVLDHYGVEADDHEHLISMFAGTNGGEKRPRPRATREEREELEELEAPLQRMRLGVEEEEIVSPAVAEFTFGYLRSISHLSVDQRRKLLSRVMQPVFLPPGMTPIDDEMRMEAAIKEGNRLLTAYSTLWSAVSDKRIPDDWREVLRDRRLVERVYTLWFMRRPHALYLGRAVAKGLRRSLKEAVRAAKRVAAHFMAPGPVSPIPIYLWYHNFLLNATLNWHIFESMASVWATAFAGIENPHPLSMWPGAIETYSRQQALIQVTEDKVEYPTTDVGVLGIDATYYSRNRTMGRIRIAGAPTERGLPLRALAAHSIRKRFGKIVMMAMRNPQVVLRIPSLLWPEELANARIVDIEKRSQDFLILKFQPWNRPYVLFDPPMRVQQPEVGYPKPMFFSLLTPETPMRTTVRLEQVVILDAINATRAFSRILRAGSVLQEEGTTISNFITLDNVAAFKDRPVGSLAFGVQRKYPVIIAGQGDSRQSMESATGVFRRSLRDAEKVVLEKWGWEVLGAEEEDGVIPVRFSTPRPVWLDLASQGRILELPPERLPEPMAVDDDDADEEDEPMEDVEFPPFIPYRAPPGEARVGRRCYRQRTRVPPSM